MTTRVLITNLGPDDINVNVCQRSSAADDGTAIESHTLCPGESTEAMVYGWHQDLAVVETAAYEDGHTHREPSLDSAISDMFVRARAAVQPIIDRERHAEHSGRSEPTFKNG